MREMSIHNFMSEYKEGLFNMKDVKPIYQKPKEEWVAKVEDLERTLFDAQAKSVYALAKLYESEKMGILNGEMGCGKSCTSIATAKVILSGKNQRTMVLCPPHLVYKWRNEILTMIPDAEVIILNGGDIISKLNNIRRNLKDYNHKRMFFIMGRVRLRMGGNFRHAFAPVLYKQKITLSDGSKKVISEYVKGCPRCGTPFSFHSATVKAQGFDESEYKDYIPFSHDISDVSKKYVCRHSVDDIPCANQLWSASEEKDVLGMKDKLINALKTLKITKKKIAKIISMVSEEIIISAIEDNYYNLINLMDENGQFVFNDSQAKRLEVALKNTGLSLSNSLYQPSEFIKRYFPNNWIGLLIADEAHEYKASSGQGNAFGVLANVSSKVLALTGTLIGGYASDLFYLLWRMNPSMMKEFGYGEAKSIAIDDKNFTRDYGMVKCVEKYDDHIDNDMFEDSKTSEGKKVRKTYHPAPGFTVKGVVRFILPYTVFISLDDIDANALPKYTETSEYVALSPSQAEVYKTIGEDAIEIKKDKFKSKYAQVVATMYYILSYPDRAYQSIYVDGISINEPVDDDILPKEQRMLDIIEEAVDNNRKVIVYTNFTGKDSLHNKRLAEIVTNAGYTPAVLTTSVKALDREEWIVNKVEQGIDVLITNPKLVETGLDLLDFPSIIFMNTMYNVYTIQQASRRSWRIGQTEEVKVHFLCYEETLEAKCYQLMAEKIKVALGVSGLMPKTGLDDINPNIKSVQQQLAESVMGLSFENQAA